MLEPVVIVEEEERDFLFDNRTGYAVMEPLSKEVGHFDKHPYGEGDDRIFTILRAKPTDITGQYEYAQVVDPETGAGQETRRRIRKLDLAHFNANCVPANRINSGLLSNVYKFQARFVTGSDADFLAERGKYDDKKNAVRTVGTGFTFATISGSITPAASGDVSAVSGNGATPLVSGDYNENIVDNGLDGYQLIGMLESNDGILPGIRIHAAAGIVINVTGNNGWHIENFEIDGEGTATWGLLFVTNEESTVARCVIHDANRGLGLNATRGCLITNVATYNCTTTGIYTVNSRECLVKHCSAIGCGDGFNETNLADDGFFACLGADNSGADFAGVYTAASCAWNVSEDLTAPGNGARTGFNITNLVNIFQLATAGENGANIDGWPLVAVDYLHNTRKNTTLIFYAGAHDPDPGVAILTQPLLVMVDNQDGTVTATLTNNAGQTSFIKRQTVGETAITTLAPAITGNAAQAYAQADGQFFFFAQPHDTPTDCWGEISNIAPLRVLNGSSKSRFELIMEAVRDQISDAAFANESATLYTVGIQIPPDFTKDTKTPRIIVFPDGDDMTPNRNKLNEWSPRVNVAICSLTESAAGQTNRLLTREDILDIFVGRRLVYRKQVHCKEESSPSAVNLEELWEKFKWVSVVTLEFVELTARG